MPNLQYMMYLWMFDVKRYACTFLQLLYHLCIVLYYSSGSLIIQHDVVLSAPVNPLRMESVRQALYEAWVMSVVIRVDTTNTSIVGVPVILGVNQTQCE